MNYITPELYGLKTKSAHTVLTPELYGLADVTPGTPENGAADILRVAQQNNTSEADVKRVVHLSETGTADITRKISGTRYEETNVDISRVVAFNGHYAADVLRQVEDYNASKADIERIVDSGVPEDGTCDIERAVRLGESENADLEIRITAAVNQNFDTERILAAFIDEDFDAERILAAFINQDFDAERNLYAVVDQDFDTEVNIPHTATISPVPDPTPSPEPAPVPQENTGTIRSISVTINEQQITDDLTIETVSDYNIMELVQGSYLDYAFSMRIESMTRSRGITTARCCSDVDELLYTQLAYNVPQNERWHVVNNETSEEEEERVAAASTHIAKIAAALGKVPVLQFSDFISTMDIEPQGVTYADLIRELFGWTSSLPQMLINCYIRNDRLYVIQRGYEQNQIDLTNSKRTAPTIARELVRTTWGSDVWSKTETKTRDRYMWDKVDIEFYPEESGERNSEYTYDSDGLVSSSVTLDETSEGTTKTEVYYHYTTINKRKFLSHEETIITYNSGTSNEETETRHVYHTPLNNGQEHVHGVDSDGEPIGSNVGNKGWNDKVSPYSQYLFAGYAKNITKTPIMKQEELQRTLYGISLIDTSFPVVGNQKLIELTNAIKWLNRKTMETVEFSVYDHPHLIDFNDRIVLDGNTYYLQSNSAIRDTRNVNRQNLRIVRWY